LVTGTGARLAYNSWKAGLRRWIVRDNVKLFHASRHHKMVSSVATSQHTATAATKNRLNANDKSEELGGGGRKSLDVVEKLHTAWIHTSRGVFPSRFIRRAKKSFSRCWQFTRRSSERERRKKEKKISSEKISPSSAVWSKTEFGAYFSD